MSANRLRLCDGVGTEPRYGDDMDLDCRLLLIGDRYRQLLRVYTEVIFRLSSKMPLADREAFLRSSAEINQYYEISSGNGKLSLRMREPIFRDQASLKEIDVTLHLASRATRVLTPMSLDLLQAAGTLVHLLNGEYSKDEVHASLEASLGQQDRTWAKDALAQWTKAALVEEGPLRPNPLLASTNRPRATFMGHSSILFQSKQSAVLTDPLFRVRAGAPPIAFDSMRMKLGAICCSHSHWDHCDVATLLRFDKRTPIVVPRVRTPSMCNPPMIPTLTRLGFTDIREIDTWQSMMIDDIELVAVPFHGEQDEPDIEIDHYTYVLRTDGLSIYGGVDAYRDTFGEMLPALERVRREWSPDVVFLPVSRMTYYWRNGGVNGFCRYVDTDLLEKGFQYTASADDAVEWAKVLNARRVVPYATFNFNRYQVPPQSKEFELALGRAGMLDRLLPLRPFDAVEPSDLEDNVRTRIRRQALRTFLNGGATAHRIDGRLSGNLGYRLAKRLLRSRRQAATHHH